MNAIAKAHGIPEPTLRRLAKKYAWVRGAPEVKRRIVEDHFAGVTKGLTNDEVRQNQAEAASQDILDMERALRINRHCLLNLEVAAEKSQDPKEIKIIVEATGAAVASIRKIRGLDAPNSADAKDIDAAIEAELAQLERDRQAGAAADPQGA
ncbi:hypothetical protein [Paraburkholderia caribensis]|uniref:hypothetical protein n=1 Tax=Paraburkholderia caribensis TaxID=75105 RepID=UPI0028544358|nr:hypothetical protein [Paraburkholderia caribensis]MDR6381816.1 hypothetical protein [Paraburkholderia caribensis]